MKENEKSILLKKYTEAIDIKLDNSLKLCFNQLDQSTLPYKIDTKFNFLRIGKISTKYKKFESDLYIECSWEDDKLFMLLWQSSLTNNQKINTNLDLQSQFNLDPILKIHKSFKYDPNVYWYPRLYIENSNGELDQEISYETTITQKALGVESNSQNYFYNRQFLNYTIKVTEMRFIKGSFRKVISVSS